ncbi:uncharacterized protein CIMG_12599 [Coccidioides immitis RS]|uniref:Uncharacterized protein n=1 Tax=Coccidioides immitis (strain RS) TaxID=246410 RepID=A0A0E1RZ97_COCIM|nr:uncharacterized protein CIMG_12599 [Coccidioides immitis RS]EAS37587.2 hypothetical protein CIMG_12599 [Coccidioides immitis RS]
MAPTIILSNIGSVMAMAHCKHITVNTDDMKLVLGISTKIGLNYFGLIDVPDCPVSAATTCCLCAASASPTTAAASLPFSGAIRVSACQMVSIRAPVWFTKLVLEEQKEKKEEEKEREKKNDDDDEDDDNDN